MKITVTEPLGIDQAAIDRLMEPFTKRGIQVVYHYDKAKDEAELCQRCADSDIIITANQPFPDSVVRACKKAKLIDVAFTGTDHIGKKAAVEMGITVCNAQGYATEAVAELAIALAIDLLRSVVLLDASIRLGGTRGRFVGRELKGKTFGVIGTGAIGIRTAELAKAFGCDVIGWSRTRKSEAEAAGIRYVSFDEVLEQSDILSLHVPLNDATRGMIGAEQLSKMKPTALLINTARGAVVDEDALAAALKSGKIGGAGLDVFAGEPPLPEEAPILYAPNTILTPHIAFVSEESFDGRAEIVFENALAFIDGNPVNVVGL